MTLAAFDSHNFAATGNMEAALGPFMGFDFRHDNTPLLLLFFSLGFSLCFLLCFSLLGTS
jgi:hypothetical protein